MAKIPESVDWENALNSREAEWRVTKHLHSIDVAHRFGFKPVDLVKDHGWFVGSQVWRPALNLPIDAEADLDIVCVDPSTAKSIMYAIQSETKKGLWGSNYVYQETVTVLGGHRLVHKDSPSIKIDIWGLRCGMTIAEHIIKFPHRHQRFAWQPRAPLGLGLTRAVYDDPTREVVEALYKLGGRQAVIDYVAAQDHK